MTSSRSASLIAFLLLASTGLYAQTLPGFLLFTDPAGRFSIEFPGDWNWTIISPSGEPLATFVHPSTEAAVIVEHFRLNQPLGPDDVTELFADIELERVRESQRGVQSLQDRVVTRGGRPWAIIDYVRPGLREDERVRQYSIPSGDDLYRITCAALASRFARHEATCEAVAGTLKPASELPPTPAAGS